MIIRGLRAEGSQGVSRCSRGKLNRLVEINEPLDSLRRRRQRGSVALRLIPRNLAPFAGAFYLRPAFLLAVQLRLPRSSTERHEPQGRQQAPVSE
jgi:hypothetical protein